MNTRHQDTPAAADVSTWSGTDLLTFDTIAARVDAGDGTPMDRWWVTNVRAAQVHERTAAQPPATTPAARAAQARESADALRSAWGMA